MATFTRKLATVVRFPFYIEGRKVLVKKIRCYGPEVVALVGLTVYRNILPLVDGAAAIPAGTRPTSVVGPQPITIHGSRCS